MATEEYSVNIPSYEQMATFVEQHASQGETLESLLAAIEAANELKEEELALKKAELAQQWVNTVGVENMTLSDIAYIVKQGWAANYFQIGDQITTTYTYSGTEYEMPWDIVAFETVTLEDGEEVPGMILQSHYATVESLMFDGYEAFYYAEEGLSAGTYYITAGYTSSQFVSGTSYQFTLTEDVPSGGCLAGFRLAASSSYTGAITDLSVYSYDSDLNLLETVAIEEGSDGTSLGTVYASSAAADSGLNHGQRFMFGYNRWSQSAYRQWLNSDADAGSWWTSQNDYDLPPDQASTYAGFMQGLASDFLEVLKPIKQTTALNTVEGLSDTSEDTYDTFFLPSLEQEYIVPQLSGVEGDYWPYWKQVLGLTEPQERYSSATVTNANENHIRYALNSQSSKQHVRLRSAFRGNANGVWYVASAGIVSYYYACTAYRSAPACCIC